MNFMGYGKATTRFPVRRIGTPLHRNSYVPDKFWVQSKATNRHDLFFKPQQEDLEENVDEQTNGPHNPGDETLLTIKATSFFNHEESSLYLVITEGRGNASCEVGIAAIDIKRPELILSQISDNFWYTGLLTKIAILCPSEILLPQALIGSSNRSKLYVYIKSTYPDLPVKGVPRRQFNDKTALEIIDRIHNSKYQSIRNMIAKKYYALTAASALLQYLEYILNYNFAPNSLKIRYDSKDGCMMIDLDTSHHLELLYPTCKTKERQACLFGVLNFCVTNIGKRNLRAQILQPSCQLEQITTTQECIKEFSENQELFVSLERLLMKFQSVDKLMKFAVLNVGSDIPNSSETMIGQALQLKICLENVPELLNVLSTINNSYFDDIKAVLSSTSYRQMLDQINRVIHPDIQITTGTSQFFQRLHALNPKISSYLDLNRENYAKLVEKMSDIIGDLSVTYNQQFRMKFMTSKGFHIQLALSKGGQLPSLDPSLEIMSTTKNTINLTTHELRMLNLRMFDVVQQIHMESNRLISELINGIRQNMSHLYDLAGFISSLDIMLSLAKYSINSNGCCPTFSSEMNIIDGIHPLLEHNRTKTTPVPNGVIANNEYNFFVITGPNMGGKTVYLKMIAVLQIIAQLGCFVPAKTAQFRLTDKILSRIGFSDRIECNLSGFVLEMRETEYIFKNITPNSLVIIDELCRSTNPEEGEVLAWDICERFVRLIGVSNDGQYLDEAETPAVQSKSSNKSINLCSITSPFIFFVTHFDSITKLQDKFLSVVNLHFSANEEVIDGKVHLTYSYRIEDGVNQIKNYGISLAQYMNFPSDVITKATHMAEQLRQKQLPEPNRNSNLLFNNSSANKRSSHRSTLLETSTSEQSHILRLFYNLYADMNSINRMAISVEEKTEILNRKMTDLQDELPSHVLEMARQGNLFEMFKLPQRVPASNVHASPAVTINEEPRHCRTDSNVSHSNTDTNGSTHFSLLSEHSISRRIGNDLRGMYNIRTPSLSPELSPNRQVERQHQSFERSFRNNEMQNVLPAPDFELNFDDHRSVENELFTPFDVMDRDTSNMAPGMNFMAKGLTQYFSNLSPQEGGMVVRHERVTEEFVYSPVVNMSDNNYTDFGSLRTSTKLPAVSSNITMKSNLSNNLKSSSSASTSASASASSLFRLKLKEPVKVRDNRILKTPPKNSKGLRRTHNLPKRKLTIGDLKDKTTRKVNFSSVDTDESRNVRTSTARSSDSHDKPFHLNLTQFCSAEAINESPFFDSTKDLSVTDRRSASSTKQNDITPVNSPRSQLFDTFDEPNISNLTAVPPQDDFMLQFGENLSHQLKNVIDSDVSQEYSDSYRILLESNQLDFEQFETPEDIAHQSSQLNFEQFDASKSLSNQSNKLNFEQFERSPNDLSHKSNQLNFEQFEASNDLSHQSNQLNFEHFETTNDLGHQSNQLNFEQFKSSNDLGHQSNQFESSVGYGLSKDLSHQSNQMNIEHYETTKTVPSSALQFIQHAYGSQSDTESGDSDTGLLELTDVRSNDRKIAYSSRSDYQDVPLSNEVTSNSQNPKVSTFLQNMAVPCSNNIRVSEEEPLTNQLPKAVTDTKCSGKLNETKSLEDNIENLDDLILPAPPQFL